MGIRIDCPHCGVKSEAQHILAGKKVKCAKCQGVMIVPVPIASLSEVSPPPPPQQSSLSHVQEFSSAPPAIATTNSIRARSRRHSHSLVMNVVSFLVLLTISGSAIVTGYFMLNNKLAFLQGDAQSNEANKTTTKSTHLEGPHSYVNVTPRKPVAPIQRREVRQEKRTPIDRVAALNFPELPKYVRLSESSSNKEIELFKSPIPTSFSFSSVDSRLRTENNFAIWQSDSGEDYAIAELSFREGIAFFSWQEGSPEGGVSAVFNSLLTIDLPTGTERIAMREPEVFEPNSLDLEDPVVRIIARCPYPPNPKLVRFTLIPDSKFPGFTTTGHGLDKLSLRDETILWYSETEGAATKLSLRKRGKYLSAELYSRYRLPSGDQGTLTIFNGVKKRKDLNKYSLKNPRVSAEVRALNRISKLSQNVILANSFAYRFFIVIDDHELDLVISNNN